MNDLLHLRDKPFNIPQVNIDYQTQYGRKKTPYGEECVLIEGMRDKKREKHSSTENTDLSGARGKATSARSHHVEKECRKSIRHRDVICDAFMENTGIHRTHNDTGKKVESGYGAHNGNHPKDLFSFRVFFHQQYGDRYEDRPEDVGEHHEAIGHDIMKE